jgi:hypothetical protein
MFLAWFKVIVLPSIEVELKENSITKCLKISLFVFSSSFLK